MEKIGVRKYCSKILGSLFIFLILNIMNAYGKNMDYICGSDRYETASIIASKMQYSAAILVNGKSLAELSWVVDFQI
ncbi:hypothetical protein GCM10008908_14220 [Clostridium subterminale]|uniref:Uncharacterized protein n=2 Tax=Clostridium subterminale TaxID=1550 RepID=A0ABN1KMA3_CLOSU